MDTDQVRWATDPRTVLTDVVQCLHVSLKRGCPWTALFRDVLKHHHKSIFGCAIYKIHNSIWIHKLNAENPNNCRTSYECRLMLFNACRGREPAWMTIFNWNDVWLRYWPLPADAAEELYPCLKLMYHKGKRIGSLIPCLVLADVVPALDKLVYPETHQYCDIHHATTSFSQQCGPWTTTFQAGMQLAWW